MVQLTANQPYITLRVKFKKVGNLQYISHLDLVRTMNKILVRAKLPLWYTEGFNPKPKMIFAAPLSIGTESITEYMDVRLIDDIPADEAMRRLNQNMTDEMQVLEAYYVENKLTDLKWISYSINITTDNASEELAKQCDDLLKSDHILIEKKAKPGTEPKTSDIKSGIKYSSVVFDKDHLHIDCILFSDASAFLNPEYVVKALKKYCHILENPDLTKEYYTIMRLEAFKDDMTPFR